MENNDLVETVQNKVEKAIKEMGNVNVIIAGKTGVGKSTLLNSVFRGNIAKTGSGRPVSKNVREYSKEDVPINIIDTRGLELEDYHETISELKKEIKKRSKDPDPSNHVHLAWLCISEGSRRVEEAETDLADMLSKHMPVVGVITKSRVDNGFRSEVQKLVPVAKNVVRVRALREELDGGHVLEPMGLQNLMDLTMEVVPEGQKNALAAAQKVKIEHKAERAHKRVITAATAAASAGATPIPFADAGVLVPIQVGMLAGISAVFGIPLSKAFIGTLVSSVFAGSAGVMGGRAIVTSIMKMIPGAGSVAGGAIAGSTAAMLTTAFGEAYIAALKSLVKNEAPEDLSPDDIATEFKSKLSNTEWFDDAADDMEVQNAIEEGKKQGHEASE